MNLDKTVKRKGTISRKGCNVVFSNVSPPNEAYKQRVKVMSRNGFGNIGR